jgi:hypothetical protein
MSLSQDITELRGYSKSLQKRASQGDQTVGNMITLLERLIQELEPLESRIKAGKKDAQHYLALPIDLKTPRLKSSPGYQFKNGSLKPVSAQQDKLIRMGMMNKNK